MKLVQAVCIGYILQPPEGQCQKFKGHRSKWRPFFGIFYFKNLGKNASIGFGMHGIMFSCAKNVDPFYISIENQVFEYTAIKGLP